jgi:hypothetical protein
LWPILFAFETFTLAALEEKPYLAKVLEQLASIIAS